MPDARKMPIYVVQTNYNINCRRTFYTMKEAVPVARLKTKPRMRKLFFPILWICSSLLAYNPQTPLETAGKNNPKGKRQGGLRTVRLVLPVTFALLAASLFLPSEISAEVHIPEHEYLGYFDSNDVYTVIGNIKNENNFAIIPTVTVSVADDSQVFSRIIEHVPIAPQKEIPFKVKFPEIQSDSPALLDADLTFVQTSYLPATLEVLYDETLIKHDDGHLTGRIQNTGDRTIHFPTVHAVVHGYDFPLDMYKTSSSLKRLNQAK